MEGIDTRATVLVVDDNPVIRLLLEELLSSSYRVLTAESGSAAFDLLQRDLPDIVLLDIMLPDCTGFDVCKRLKEDEATRELPVIFLTTMDDVREQARGLELGAVDYVTKPVHPLLLTARLSAHLRAKEAADLLRDREAFLEREVSRRTADTRRAQEVTILALTSLGDARDDETGSHSRRTRNFVRVLAERLKDHPRFASQLDPATRELLVQSAPLHDIGKIGIPDSILRKPGRLTAEEYAVMRTHPMMGRDALQRAEDELGIEVPFLRLAKELAYSHHERWNGSGYPEGRRGDDIPVSARLMAIADVYDALSSRRAYKSGMPHRQVVEFITERRSIDFDPDVTDAFLHTQDEFHAIASEFMPGDETPSANAHA
ncbi:response regulator [Lysobacter sp. LF1]|uniref:Response regulator n=1 Tax=Lysobacter stagni TaxID=3045172 RepID=A0ABT6XIE9_9GAMM|nr:HD domain-containing phosphohydrolase [Lysobacter sp. LF1]MDI9239921.1 response regulator [Lysobacter sp. LF1]